MTPLHWAVESGDIACVELLLRHGADVETVSRFDKTPLEIASDRHFTDIYEMLLVSYFHCMYFKFYSGPSPDKTLSMFEEKKKLKITIMPRLK